MFVRCRGLVGEIIGRFERRGFKLVALKLVQVGLSYRIHMRGVAQDGVSGAGFR